MLIAIKIEAAADLKVSPLFRVKREISRAIQRSVEQMYRTDASSHVAQVIVDEQRLGSVTVVKAKEITYEPFPT